MAGSAAQAAAARESQRLLLRLRSDGREAAAGEAVRPASDVGDGDRRGWTPDQGAESGADAAGHARVPVAGRGHELVFAVLQPGDGTLLRADVREMQRVHEGGA